MKPSEITHSSTDRAIWIINVHGASVESLKAKQLGLCVAFDMARLGIKPPTGGHSTTEPVYTEREKPNKINTTMTACSFWTTHASRIVWCQLLVCTNHLCMHNIVSSWKPRFLYVISFVYIRSSI